MTIDSEQVAHVIREAMLPYAFSPGNGDCCGITNNRDVIIRMRDSLLTCPGIRESAKEDIEASLRQACPSVAEVIFENHISGDLVNEALIILRKGCGFTKS